MALITTAQFWKDPGFTEGAVEVPKLADCGDVDKLPVYDIDAHYDLLPSKGRLFSELKAPLPFDVAQDLSYLYIEIEYDRPGDSVTRGYFGWIESVEMIRDDETSPQVLIRWHVDLWRTYAKDAVYGSGILRRIPENRALAGRPIQNLSYAKDLIDENKSGPIVEPETFQYSGNTYTVYWLIMCYIADRQNRSDPRYIVYPLFFRDGVPITENDPLFMSINYTKKGVTTPHRGSSLTTITAFLGAMLLQFGVASSSVTGAFVSPVCPIDYSLTVKPLSGSYYLEVALRYSEGVYPEEVHYTNTTSEVVLDYLSCDYSQRVFDATESPHSQLTTDETKYAVLRSMKGDTVGMFPPMFKYWKIHKQMRLAPTMCGMQIWMESGVDNLGKAKAEGRVVYVPFPHFPLASNSWSDYVVSGQRTYEIEQRKLTAEMQLIGGLTGAGASGVSTASSAAIAGKAAAGTLGAASALLSASQAGVGFMLNRTMDSALQNINDSKAAMKPESLIDTGDGMDWVRLYGSIDLIVITHDEYSVLQYNMKVNVYGFDVSEPRTDCTAPMQWTGPLQIEALTVRGNIPVEAKRYIKEKMNNGVRLI